MATGDSSSLSAKRARSGRAGHGRMFDADTVNIDETKVIPNSEETIERRLIRKTLGMAILESECNEPAANGQTRTTYIHPYVPRAI